jgi:RNA polymerase sigma factor (sigma-70 family)
MPPWQTSSSCPLGRSDATDPQPCHQSFTKKLDKGVLAKRFEGSGVSSAETVVNLTPASSGCSGEARRLSELDKIAARYYGRVIRFLRRRSRSAEDAADLAQDTFARLSAADIQQIREPESFLITAALNLLRDRARSASAQQAAMTVPVDDTQLVCPAPRPEQVLDAQQRMRSLETALSELSPKCRAVFVMFHFDGVAQRDIAERLHISVSMVEKYVRQALGHCQKRLDELHEGTRETGGFAP